MSEATMRHGRRVLGAALLLTMFVATPAAAQVVRAEVGVDGMT